MISKADRVNALIAAPFLRWNSLFPNFGRLAFAAFLIALVTGILLGPLFDVRQPDLSLQLLRIFNPSASFLRALHYWSGQFFLVALILHGIEYLAREGELRVGPAIWWRLTATIPLALFLMLSGFMLNGQPEAAAARRILGSLFSFSRRIDSLPGLALLGGRGDFQILYLHHLATTTVFLYIIIAEHARKFWSDATSLLYSGALTLGFALAFPVGPEPLTAPVLKGPWYFLGLQEILHQLSRPLWIWMLLFPLFLSFAALQYLKSHRAGYFRLALYGVFLAYLLLTVVAYFFRGAGWELIIP